MTPSWTRHFNKLNPLNSLFGRIFIWFWLTTLVIIVVTVVVVRQYMASDDLQSIPMNEQQMLTDTAEQLVQLNITSAPFSIRRALKNLEMNHRVQPLLLRHSDNRIFHRRPVAPEFEARFRGLKNANSAYGFLAHNHVFFGPQVVDVNGQKYSLFIGRPLRFPLFQRNSGVLIGTAIFISGVLCLLLTWQLTQPLKRLRIAAQKMAQGELQTRVQHVGRQDELGQLSHDFNTMAEKLSDLVSGQKRLLADISHELRSPLARLQLAIGIAQEQPSEQNTRAMMTRIEKEALQIDTMIEQVLQLSRLENDTVEAAFEQLDFSNMMTKIVADAQYEATSVDKHIDIDMQGKQILRADPRLLSSGIENVIRNAIKYAQGHVLITTRADASSILISISDDGDGVPEKDIPHLFLPFFRVSTARSRASGGTGLGLAIAKQAIKVHNGSIIAKNRAQGGLVVEISLPRT